MIPELELLRDKLNSRVQTGRIKLDEQSESSFSVVPTVEDSFPINVHYSDGRYVIEVEPWHGHFEDLQSAGAVVCWLLTPYYRVVTSVGNEKNIATWLEIYADDGWNGTEFVYFVDPNSIESTTDGADTIKILTQAVFLDSAFTTYYPGAHIDSAGYPLGTIIGQTSYVRRNDGWYPVGVPEAE